MDVRIEPIDPMTQMERDLLLRITENFARWTKDSAALYAMGGLPLTTFERDRFILLLGAIAVEVAHRDIPIGIVARELLNFIGQVREQMKND